MTSMLIIQLPRSPVFIPFPHLCAMQEELRSAAVLVLANKQDLPGAASPAQLTDYLGMHSLRGRTW